MVTERVEFDGALPEHRRLMWCAWLRHHGIDPNDVLITNGWIERREAERQIAWHSLRLDERGRVVMNEDRTDPVFEVHMIQLEAAPSPWPEVGVDFSPWGAPQDTRRHVLSLSPRSTGAR